ncbi:uncharacterized protein [Epargyreus clarus]|uniref:uncharacterized protein isoform X2 n=1 Tax=Epargyreus clarus TaxID=520877 RepID=UPI003C2FB796
MTEKEITMEELEETVKRTDEQLDLMEWKMDNVEKSLAEPVANPDVCVMNLLKSVSEPLGSVDERSENNFVYQCHVAHSLRFFKCFFIFIIFFLI